MNKPKTPEELMARIEELEQQGKENSAEIKKLKKQLEGLENNESELDRWFYGQPIESGQNDGGQ